MIKKIFSLLLQTYEWLRPKSVQYHRVKPWFAIDGDNTLRLEYPLNDGSLVFDLGGYEGTWAGTVFNKYGCKIWIFEPIQSYAKAIENKFSHNPQVKVFAFGLADGHKTETILIDGASSSSLNKQLSKVSQQETIQLIKGVEFLESNNIQHIDLMKINIEGGEYDLLEHLIETGWVKKIENIQVQFHDFVPNAEQRMRNIQQKLLRTHKPTYQFEFVWENWKLKL